MPSWHSSLCPVGNANCQQDIFDAAIMDINTKIVALNERNNLPTPWIAKRVHVPRKNGMHHQYCRLNDGIHWDIGLKRACAEKFAQTIVNIH